MMWGYYYGPMNFFGGIISVIWWVFVIWAVIHVFKWMRHEGRKGFHLSSSALDILKERYAKGEIDKKEFEEKKKDLE
jgi:putative membrane protein